MKKTDITSLRDYASLEQLARSLWTSGGKGRAAVFVGAGYSRNAQLASPDTPKPPLWWELANKLADQMSPGSAEWRNDQLRLAEEYRAYFGRAALETELRTLVVDSQWFPGEAHINLLKLPWSDVLTTNYDSLLERTAAEHDVGQFYSIVRSEFDLVCSPAPRIVKLHGTVGIDKELCLTEEDFRRYPEEHAAFVNLARQVFIENDLCLVGFSGSDPNFLQWSGWVRDRLAGGHRRIFLVGALNLTEPARRVLEERNIAPIDLTPLLPPSLPDSARHEHAIDLFLKILVERRPAEAHEWARGREASPDFGNKLSDAAAKERVLGQLKTWEAERLAYPGWVICPSAHRMHLRHESSSTESLLKRLWKQLDNKEKAHALLEFVWRCDTSFVRLPSWLISGARDLLVNAATYRDDSHAAMVHSSLLRTVREERDWETFDSVLAMSQARFNAALPPEVAYQDCLRSRDLLDYGAVLEKIETLNSKDAYWKVRQAALWFEVGHNNHATQILAAAVNTLRQAERLRPDSIACRSRRAWATWFHQLCTLDGSAERNRQYREWGDGDSRSHCNPWDEVTQITDDVHRELARYEKGRAERYVPGFRPGTYSDSSRSRKWFVHPAVTSADSVKRLTEVAGIPMRASNINLMSMAEDAVSLLDDRRVGWYLELFRTQSKPTHRISRAALSRLGIAQLKVDVAQELFDRLLVLLDHAVSVSLSQDHGHARWWGQDTAERCLTWLGRVVVRLSPNHVHRLLLSLQPLMTNDFAAHHSHGRVLDDALHGCGEALSDAMTEELALLGLEFPDARGNSTQGTVSLFPFLSLERVERRSDELRWSKAIRRLIEQAAENSVDRPAAALKLLSLLDADLLSDSERADLGPALWQHVDDFADLSLPSNTNLLPFALARLPAPQGIDPIARASQRIWAVANPIADDKVQLRYQLGTLRNARRPVPPPPEVAHHLFDAVIALLDAPPQGADGPDAQPTLFDDQPPKAVRFLGELLTELAAYLPDEHVTFSRATAVLNAASKSGIGAGLPALPRFVRKHPDLLKSFADTLLPTLAKSNWEAKAFATAAVSEWFRSEHLRIAYQEVSQRFLDAFVMTLHGGTQDGLVDVLRNTLEVIQTAALDRDQAQQLAKAAATLVPFLNYSAEEPESRIATTISLMRSNLVQVLEALRPSWPKDLTPTFELFVDSCLGDPLPEVRTAAIKGRQDHIVPA